MNPLSRRSVIAGSAAAVTALPMSYAIAASDPNKKARDLLSKLNAAYDEVTAITPAEYMAEMEANGWRPTVSIWHDGTPLQGVAEYTVNYPPLHEDMEFLYYINWPCG